MQLTHQWYVDIRPQKSDINATIKRAMAKPNTSQHPTMNPDKNRRAMSGAIDGLDGMEIMAGQNELFRRNVVDGWGLTDDQMIAIWWYLWPHRYMSNGKPYPVDYISGARRDYNRGTHAQPNGQPPEHERCPKYRANPDGGPGIRMPTNRCPDEHIEPPKTKTVKKLTKR